MRINELFVSIQGEGKQAGLPTIFVRTAGCNLARDLGGCSYCDTKYAWADDAGDEISIDEIVARCRELKYGRVCVTGGEPLCQPDIIPLLNRLFLENQSWVAVETNGSLPIPRGTPDLTSSVAQGVSFNLDFKCPSSGMSDAMDVTNFSKLRNDDQIKFVVGDKDDYIFARDIVLPKLPHWWHGERLFQPVASVLDPKELVAWILEDNLDVRLSLQIHKIIFGANRRGV